MTLVWHRRLFLAESILLTLPFFLVVCFFGGLGLISGFTSASDSIAFFFEALVVSTTGIAGAAALVYLSCLYLSRGLEALQKSDRRAWIAAAMGAALTLLAVVAREIIQYSSTDRLSVYTGFLAFAGLGAPLLIPYFHTRRLRDLKWLDEVSP